MNADELAAAHAIALDLGAWASAETRAYRVSDVDTKAHPADLVTELDRAIERRVRAVIAERFAEHAFVGEEYGGSPVAGKPTWYLDPVDGTTNLANGVPWTSFSLALAIDDRPLLGVVADPWRDIVFDARAGEGARQNGEPLHVGDTATLRGGVVSTELAGHEAWPGMLEFSRALTERFCTLRVMGSGTLTLLGPAAGRGSAAVVHRFSPIDHLAAVLIAHEAGAEVWDEAGRPSLFPAYGGVMVAAPGVADELFGAWHMALGRDRA
ncbi:inositol monophosphatase [Microbacterium sp. VKM Ac-2870]|uniref:inositol monophosphatase family protein n=1 Tax=Microbacterium sp. VKM Ac-2870 TaxID=2783825 RepID=UPI00188CA30A|nr:inositol monophosphatase [Microbacterium sp. VKM Ac-2870]MBF4562661.1 inositol monophosphatase [Microbacterium sp. VKM Ac-2870]